VDGGVVGGVGDELEGRGTAWSIRCRRLDKDWTISDRGSQRVRRSSCLENVVGGGGEILGEECHRASTRGSRSTGTGGEDSVLKRVVMKVNKVLKGVAQNGKISWHFKEILMQLVHLETIVLSQRSGVTEEPVLRVVEIFYNLRITEDWQTLLIIRRDGGLHHIHVTICELTSPINNWQHCQLKMETYLNIGDVREGGNTRVTGVDRGGCGVGRRHCKV
jgi:hypothetical protein